jgi:hypothetical protein
MRADADAVRACSRQPGEQVMAILAMDVDAL